MYFRKYGPNFRKNRTIPRVPNVKCSFSCKFYYILCIFYYKLQVDPVPEISRAHTFFPGLPLTAQCFLLLVDSQNLRCRVMVDKLEKYFRKLMCWCPMKDSLLKGRLEDFLSGFKSENGNGIYDSFMLLSVFYLCLIPYLFIKYRPGTVSAMHEKIIITRPLRKPVVIHREEIMQISVKENENNSWRWSFRLIYFGFILLILFLAPYRSGINLKELVMYIPLLLAYYSFEILKPYQCVLKIITCSNLRLWPRTTLSLWLKTEGLEKITRVLKKRTNLE